MYQAVRVLLRTSFGAVECVRPPSMIVFHPLKLSRRSGKRESSAKFEATKPLPYTDENGQFAPLLTIECRGLEFVDFDPRVC